MVTPTFAQFARFADEVGGPWTAAFLMVHPAMALAMYRELRRELLDRCREDGRRKGAQLVMREMRRGYAASQERR